ncbi:MAG: ABC transporter substrate-binding protein [bacterium]|nr:ABC transporter substrate-binding protein [bacterium]MDT8396027.1 ABC transporter substrate-binding protein [bacterium]
MAPLRTSYGPRGTTTFSGFIHRPAGTRWEPNPDLAFPGSRQFLEDFKAAYSTVPSCHAATAYASGVILEKAVRKAGGLDRKGINEALSTLDTMSLIGR